MTETEFRAEVGRRLRAARKDLGIGQRAVADAAAITQGALSNYELGKREVPLLTLIRLGDALDVPFTAFVPRKQVGA